MRSRRPGAVTVASKVALAAVVALVAATVIVARPGPSELAGQSQVASELVSTVAGSAGYSTPANGAHPVVDAVSSCADDPSRVACLSDAVLAASAGDFAAVVEDYGEAIATVDWVRESCHPISHRLGRSGFGRVGDLEEALASGSPLCELGYYHGVFEAWGDTLGPADIDSAAAVCQQVNVAAFEASPGECGHSLGHAVWRAFGDTDQALEFCATLPEPTLTTCGGGVLMVMLERADRAEASFPNTAQEVGALCSKVTMNLEPVCYSELAWVLYTELPPEQALSGALLPVCGTLPADGVEPCAGRAGALAATSMPDPAEASKICTNGPVRLVRPCLVGGAKVVSGRERTGETTRADIWCGAVADKALAADCRAAIQPGR